MTSAELVTEESSDNREVVVSLLQCPLPQDQDVRRIDDSTYVQTAQPTPQPEHVDILSRSRQLFSSCLLSCYGQHKWFCSSGVTKTKLLGLLVFPFLALSLCIFHYTYFSGSLHNTVTVLHPVSLIHPVISSPLNEAVTFIKDKGEKFFKNSEDLPITTKKGPIVGQRFYQVTATGASYNAFLGIPFGYIPARFQRAVPAKSWSSPRRAQMDGPSCPQSDVPFDEDCLFLNVFTPIEAADSPGKYPVIVYIHGSGFIWGSSSSQVFGPDFLVPKGVILVTTNYRLGAVGFLTLGSKVAPGNMGLYDVQLALQWVQDEISVFGGDPSQVTLMGESAGAVITMYQYLSPVSSAFFKYVIVQSGSAMSGWGHITPEEGARRAKALAAAVGCDPSMDDALLLACLQKTNINHIVSNQSVSLDVKYEAKGHTLIFVPVLDTSFTDKPFFNDSLANLLDQTVNRSKPMIAGFTADEGIVKFEETCWKIVEANLESYVPEGSSFLMRYSRTSEIVNGIRSRYFQDSPTENKVLGIIRLYTDEMLAVPIIKALRKLANTSYGYKFSFKGPWTPDPSYITKFHVTGVNHGFDLRYLFYSKNEPQDLGNCSTVQDSLKIRDMMVDWWINFVKTGVPGANWPKVSVGGYLNIDTNFSLINSSIIENEHNYHFWTSLQGAVGQEHGSDATLPKLDFLTVVFVALWCVTVSWSKGL